MKRSLRAASLFILVLAASCLIAQDRPATRFTESSAGGPLAITVDIRAPFTFVAYGDLREAPPSNTTATDPVRRKAIIDAIAEVHPAFVEVGGDLVARGDDPADWQQWEKETAVIRDRGIPIFPAIGNHELYRDAAQGLANYFKAFPFLKQNRFYSVRAANTITLVLDSALDETSGTQGDWLQEQFRQLPPHVDFVFLVLHHPPYTRSSNSEHGGGHGPRPKEVALAHWLEAQQKSMRARIVVIAGHVHNYERYSHGGVTYIVTGGGGATPYVIPREPGDAYRAPGPTYHYCLFKVLHQRLTMQMMRLDLVDGKALWNIGDSFALSVPPPTRQKKDKPAPRIAL